MKDHLYCSALVLLTHTQAMLWCGQGQVLTSKGCVCLRCPQGQEPSQPCGQAGVVEGVLKCQACPADTFSASTDSEPCRAHRSCASLNRLLVSPGTADRDALCGDCLQGFFSAAKGTSPTSEACVRWSLNPLVRIARNVDKSAHQGLAAVNTTNVRGTEEKTTEYAVFALVPIFCVMGLLGILICNLLKKKGYRCTADKEADEEAASAQKDGNPGPFIVDDPNEDTISVLVRLITEKKENATALEELLLEYESRQMAITKAASFKLPALPPLAQFRSLPRLCPHQRHLHTINGLALQSGSFCCSRCSQKKWPELLLSPSTQSDAHEHTEAESKAVETGLPGEVTILSVGRFQVAQIPEQKPALLELTPPESSDTDSVDTSHTEPAEEKSLLGTSSSSASSWSKSKQEVRC